ncbi:hypothetical protein VNO77_44267 [Canavalia gladiata]|uniref:Uncharacterized protein n=1 Tax=Canavalia gladiata TaxID=3824 RepID=A0AAN9PQ73_CANGL
MTTGNVSSNSNLYGCAKSYEMDLSIDRVLRRYRNARTHHLPSEYTLDEDSAHAKIVTWPRDNPNETVAWNLKTDIEESNVSDSNGDDTSWISRFFNLGGNEFFCKVEDDYKARSPTMITL